MLFIRGISTGLASSASSSRKAKQARTVREAKHRRLNNPRRNQTKGTSKQRAKYPEQGTQ